MQKAYHANIALRLMVIVPSLLFGAMGASLVFMALGGTGRGMEKMSPDGVLAYSLFFGLPTLAALGTAVAAFRMGRIEVDGTRIKLAGVPLFPLNLLPRHEIDLKRVKRWGVGQGADPSYAGVGGAIAGMAMTPAVLMFEVDGGDGTTYIRRIALGTYPSASAREIFEHVEDHCGRPVELESSFFWGLTFPASRRWA